MTLMSSELYDALRAVGVSHERALRRAEALAPSPDTAARLRRIEGLLTLVLVLTTGLACLTLWHVLTCFTR
jgi:hypothetical protein